MKKLAKLLPYFIVEKAILKYGADTATLKLRSGHEYSVNIYETASGTWIVKSNRLELLCARRKLESLIGDIDERLESETNNED